MNEDLLQYIWKTGLFDHKDLYSTDGKTLEIESRGTLNKGSGPDFSQAGIRIDGTYWYGHVEIHTQAEDWNKHKHFIDPAYNNTILHVVLNENTPCYRADGSRLPCLSLEGRISPKLLKKYELLQFSPSQIACAHKIKQVSPTIMAQALDRALISRLEAKSERMNDSLRLHTGDWHSVFYSLIIRSFGFGHNSEAFELLAEQIPVSSILKNEHDQKSLEALLLGTAGFLEDENMKDAYAHALKSEWSFLRKKYNISTLQKHIFKTLRLRPGNFPQIRIAQLSGLLTHFQEFINLVLSDAEHHKILLGLDTAVHPYWQTHIKLDQKVAKNYSQLSQNARNLLMINAVVPFMFVYGRHSGHENFCHKAIEMLQLLPAEKNQFIEDWISLGIQPENAAETQALLGLRKFYCEQRFCLKCPIGHEILSKNSD